MNSPWLQRDGISGPLAGLKVVDLTINILGPVATMLLADMGADVLKIESPEGDANRHIGPSRTPLMGSLFLGMNRNKRSIVLNLKKPRGMEALLRLVDDADVFVHSMRPAAARRLGIDYAVLASRNPRLVYGYAPGYRPDGPRRDMPAYDDVIQGESGIASICERSFGEPRYLPFAFADKHCGFMLAFALSSALCGRERSGCGQEVCVPMFETVLSFNLIEHLWGAAFDPPLTDIGYNRMFTAHRRPFATRDGHMCLMATNDQQWARLLQALGRPDVAEDERFKTLVNRSLNIEALYGIVTDAMKKRTSAEWDAAFTAADIPHAPVKRLEELESDAYLQETAFFKRFVHPTEGEMIGTTNPIRLSKTPAQWRLPPPNLGAHSASVLASLGYSPADVQDMSC